MTAPVSTNRPMQFAMRNLPAAMEAQRETGYPACALLAQGVIEGASGDSTFSINDNNPFGYLCWIPTRGPVSNNPTLNGRSGHSVGVQATCRKSSNAWTYRNSEEAYIGQVQFLINAPFGIGTALKSIPPPQVMKCQDAISHLNGYARCEPGCDQAKFNQEYKNKLMAVARALDLYRFDKCPTYSGSVQTSSKQGPPQPLPPDVGA